MNEQSPLEKSIFLAALEKGAPEERSDYLAKACGGDARLRADIEALLEAHERLGTIPSDAKDAGSNTEAPAAERPGVSVGPYKLLEMISEGGMGLVFVAEQERPVRRRMALKVIKPGFDTRQVIARFEAERQALALMDHPNVARVLDAGATESGRPYFVMDLIQGIPITEYCDQCDLGTQERLDLFVQVCQGIQHAHQKGIIHRDVKPSNVLIAMQDGRPLAKVIDFGIAKAMNQRLSERTLQTGFAQMLGTPLYMSPEQAEMSPLELDTRSDIYSLGVLLYELLTGTTPFERSQLGEASFDEIRRIIRDVEPPTPSTRISTLGERASAVAERRRTDARKLRQLLRGDLDWIAMRCLEKDRARRYETASALAADVERHLRDEPVEACPPSRGYRLRKLIRRNRPAIAAVACLIVAFAILAGSIGWIASDRASRRVALEREVTGAIQEAESWYRRDRVPDAVSAVKRAEGLLASAGGDVALSELVRQCRSDLDTVVRLEEIRLEQVREKDGGFDWASADHAYGEVFRRLGLDVEALETPQAAERIRASAIREDLLAGLDNWVLAKTIASLAGKERLLDIARRADGDPWRNRFRDAFQHRDRNALIELARDGSVLAQPPADILLLRRALHELKELPLAIEVLRQVQAAHPDDFWINFGLGYSLEESNPGQALDFYRAALALRPETVRIRVSLGIVLYKQGKLEEAIGVFRKAIALDPTEAKAHLNLGSALAKKGESEEAIAAFRKAIDLKPNLAVAHYNLGLSLYHQHGLDESAAAYRKAIEIDGEYTEALDNLALALLEQGKFSEAVPVLRRALALVPNEATTHFTLGVALSATGEPDEAVLEYRRAIELKPDYGEAHYNLGVLLQRQGRFDEAIAALQKAIELEPDMAKAHSNLGTALLGEGKLDEGIAALRKAIELGPELYEPHNNLGSILSDQGKLDEAIAEFQKAIKLKPDEARIHQSLGLALGRKGQLEEAIGELRIAIELQPTVAQAHENLGVALKKQGQLEEAIAAFRRAIELLPSSASGHCNLGHALRDRGEFGQALNHFRRGHELGSRTQHWRLPSARWIADCERLVELDSRLSRVLSGEEALADARERLPFADHCYRKREFELAARFFEEAFAQEPALAEDLASGHRYNAACAASLAGAGDGQEASSLGGEARSRRRGQAREWLRADLEQHARTLKDDATARAAIAKTLQHWLRDPDLKGLRDDHDLGKLPAEEREAWVSLWREVHELLRRAGREEP